MSNEERKEWVNYSDPNAQRFQPYPSPPQYNQFFAQPNGYQPYPSNNNFNNFAPNFTAPQLYPRQPIYGLQQEYVNDDAIIYDVYELKESTIAKLNSSNDSNTGSDAKTKFLHLLVSGYCQRSRFPVDLLLLCVQYCGSNISSNELVVGISVNNINSGFYCIDFGTAKTVEYVPKAPYIMNDYKILTTATELILPSHLIKYYNTLTQNTLSEHTLFNAMFITPKFNANYEIFCILFNEEHALELKLPQFKCNLTEEYADFPESFAYSSKYGLMTCYIGKLISFCWDTWQWSEIAKHQKAFEGNPVMLFLESQNKLFLFSTCARKWINQSWMPTVTNFTRHCYLYDMNESAIREIPCGGTFLDDSDCLPIFCFDSINERIFAFQNSISWHYHGSGMSVYLDMKTCQWKETNFPRFVNKVTATGKVDAIWFDGVEQTLYVIVGRTDWDPASCWKYCRSVRDWQKCGKYQSLMRTDLKYIKVS